MSFIKPYDFALSKLAEEYQPCREKMERFLEIAIELQDINCAIKERLKELETIAIPCHEEKLLKHLLF